jgi:hypothetical protein
MASKKDTLRLLARCALGSKRRTLQKRTTIRPDLPEPEPKPKLELTPNDERIPIQLGSIIIEQARREFDDLIEKYAPGRVDARGRPYVIPERIQEYLRTLFYCRSEWEARNIASSACNKLYTSLMTAWASHKITGPNTVRNLEKRAKAAEAWAARLEKEGKLEEATKQREKAASIRAIATQK